MLYNEPKMIIVCCP